MSALTKRPEAAVDKQQLHQLAADAEKKEEQLHEEQLNFLHNSLQAILDSSGKPTSKTDLHGPPFMNLHQAHSVGSSDLAFTMRYCRLQMTALVACHRHCYCLLVLLLDSVACRREIPAR